MTPSWDSVLNRPSPSCLNLLYNGVGDEGAGEAVEHCSQLSGAFGRELNECFIHSVEAASASVSTHKHDTIKEVLEFVTEYHQDKLFDFIPG